MVDVDGFEPPMFLMSLIYSQLPSTVRHTHPYWNTLLKSSFRATWGLEPKNTDPSAVAVPLSRCSIVCSNMVPGAGFEPAMFLMWEILSLLRFTNFATRALYYCINNIIQCLCYSFKKTFLHF